MNPFQTEPAVIIGLIGSVVVGVLQQIAGSGLVTSDRGQSFLNLLLTIAPLIFGFITRSIVSSPATVAAIRAGTAPKAV